MVRDERLRAEAGRAETRFRARQLERVDVEPDQASAGLHALEDRSRMAAAAERAVDRDVAGCGPQAAQDFLHHDRPVRARRRLAGLEDLLHVRGVPLGVQLLVLVVERARVLARVSRAPLVPRRRIETFATHDGLSSCLAIRPVILSFLVSVVNLPANLDSGVRRQEIVNRGIGVRS